MNPIERMLFAVATGQRQVERAAALVRAARMISNKARAVRQRSVALRLLVQRQRAKPAV